MKKLLCATYEGLDAKVVDVEMTQTKGLPSFSIVGSANAINSSGSADRIKSALLSNEYKFPPKRITINLAPSDDFKKSGSQFDLSIALLILLESVEKDLSSWFVFGELGLDGRVKQNNQLYPLLLSLANQNLVKKVVVPFESLEKLSKIPNLELYGVKTLKEALDMFKDVDKAVPNIEKKGIDYPSYMINKKSYYYMKEYPEDFIDVKGQELAKRVSVISASGMHNIIFNGSPGSGKSMISRRLQYILPAMKNEEILDVAKMEALDMKEPTFSPRRPFVSCHCTSTLASIFGGTKMGEIANADKGILFFDELPHFSSKVIESLREPLQDNFIKVTRVANRIKYPASFLFVGAMNPCPCGNLLDNNKECRCNELEIQRYKNKLSEPFLDRIDLYIEMQNVSSDDKASYTSKEMHKMVLEANIFAQKRGQKSFNGKMSDAEIDKYCVLSKDAQIALDMAINRFTLSFRSIKKVQKVSRTIADLDSSEMIEKHHLLEALSYRKR